MSFSAVLTMVFVMIVIWGGFLLTLLIALRKEGRKRDTSPKPINTTIPQ